MVIYAVSTSGMVVEGPNGEPVSSASIGALFIAGVVPGLMLAAMLGATTFYRAWKFDYPACLGRLMPDPSRRYAKASGA